MMARTQYFYFDGVDSRNYGIYLTSAIKISGAEPNMETIAVPGRNGALTRYDGSYRNVSFVAECAVTGDKAPAAVAAIAQWATGRSGYRRLEFPWEDGYRMAYIVSGPETEYLAKHLRTFTLEFSCGPQVFTHAGQQTVSVENGGSLYNPWMEALPEITVYGEGAGELIVGETIVALRKLEDYVVLDSDTQNAFRGLTNQNSEIYAPEFPVLPHGETTIRWNGGITGVGIIPRWWHL